MSDIPNNIIIGVNSICIQSGINLTDEQRDVVYHFNDNMSVFANPGTGKTTTAVVGLIAAQTLYGFKGSTINAMSFTRTATAELSARYSAAIRKCTMSPTVQFNTFHAICLQILKDHFHDLTTYNDYDNITKELKDFSEYVIEEGVARGSDMFVVKKIYQAMKSLNGELSFSKKAVLNSSKFKEIEEYLELKQFQEIRFKWFARNYLLHTVPVGEIPLMALYVLCLNPKLAEKYRSKYELMVVDEFQDMSLLYLEVLSIISKRLIVIGDMKQQIYAFNGASPLIAKAYEEKYPNAYIKEITHSFRCSDDIVGLANDIIKCNNIPNYDSFTGNGTKGVISKFENSEKVFDSLVSVIHHDQNNETHSDIMFLSRNNSSVIPIIERLYMKGVRFRTTKFSTVMQVPIFKELCWMAEVALNSKDPEKVAWVNRFMPEFRYVSPKKNEILEVMSISPRESDKDLLTMNFSFDMNSSYVIINRLRRFKELHEEGQPFLISMSPLMDIYEEFVIGNKWWKLEKPKDYYVNLVSSIISKKTYTEMVADENDKKSMNEYNVDVGIGVRCYTFHAAKGLEADTVCMVDVDDGLIPNDKMMQRLFDMGCMLEAAKEIRNERNLMYVAATRAKKELIITYNNELSPIVGRPDSNGYTFLDKVWEENAILTNETKAFRALMRLGGVANAGRQGDSLTTNE